MLSLGDTRRLGEAAGRRALISPPGGLLLHKYNGVVGVFVAGTSCALCVVAIIVLAVVDPETDFLTWGPSPGVRFVGVTLETWPRWGCVMLYSLLSQVAQSIVYASLSPWMSNVVRDHKTPLSGDLFAYVQLIAVVYNVFQWLIGILDTFLWITAQLQFLIPALASDVIISVWTTRSFLRAKEKMEEIQETEEEFEEIFPATADSALI